MRRSNPAGGTSQEVPKDPVTRGDAEAGVFLRVQACAALSSRMPGAGGLFAAWTVGRNEEGPRTGPGAFGERGDHPRISRTEVLFSSLSSSVYSSPKAARTRPNSSRRAGPRLR